VDFDTGFLPNLLGALGVAFNIGWPFLRRRSAMLWGQTAGFTAFTGHFLVLGASTGAIMSALGGVQAVLAVPLGRDPRFRIAYIAVLPVIAVAMALTWMGLPSVFSATAMALISLGRYQLDVVRFRVLMLACIPFWSAHNVLVGSIPGLVSDFVTFTAGAWMLYVTVVRRRSADPAVAP